MTLALRFCLPRLAAALALGLTLGLSPALAQDRFIRISPNAVLVTPQGEILDYMPEAGSVRAMRDERGRTVLIDHWGNVVATVMGERHPQANQARGQGRVAPPNPDDEFGTSQPGYYGDPREAANGIPDYRDPRYRSQNYGRGYGATTIPPGVEREPLPDALPPADENQQAALPPSDENDQLALPPVEAGPRSEPMPAAQSIGKKSSAEIMALQVFLDREGFSPGAIDGKTGSNVTKAIEAWQKATGETLDPNDTDGILERLRLNGGMPLTSYTITAADAAGPYVAAIPEDYAHKAALPHLSYTSTAEMLAEKFHMDEDYLRSINLGVDFTVPGTIIKVVALGAPRTGKVTRVVADKARKQVLAYDAEGKLLAAFPASIGSADTPSPSGTVTVERIAFNPGYTYNPKINFKQGNNDKVLTLPPGPNGPVGTVWIALSKPTYGIHGTPEPSKIGKTQSHGCVRLTNWDATILAKMVSVGTTVEFVD
ncbi:hypothetical protein BJF92_10355 [Rhizobium rhizosphaerae]|uniref:L,D-TPase catalytic domain-containing protein n=1 Tax=Xaviernesmea rhizosphaerae TaxID=1672749 RepID=A0A1Q9AMD2_9HYPH|nr:L,D-transpeptidase family protein [Xaviernesmea rhizosphaerae]OLP56505.1 hypothetical protein BJF92_10355 [Xaviernesmea rhizosphaerae]